MEFLNSCILNTHVWFVQKKKNDDRIKLWREANDGMYWVHKGCKPNIDKFEIISLQVAGDILHLNVLHQKFK